MKVLLFTLSFVAASSVVAVDLNDYGENNEWDYVALPSESETSHDRDTRTMQPVVGDTGEDIIELHGSQLEDELILDVYQTHN